MSAPSFFAPALAAAWRRKRLWLLHLVANAALLAVAYGWLFIPDERVWQVLASLLVAVGLVLAVLVLHGGTLAAFVEVHEEAGDRQLRCAFARALRNAVPLLLWLAIFVGLVWLVLGLSEHSGAVSGYLHTKLPRTLRARTNPQTLWNWADHVITLAAWGLAPLLLLPLAAQFAALGLKVEALKRAARVLASWRYWIAFIALFVLGGYVPYRLVWWVHELGSMRAEMMSLVARFTAAYLLAITCWMLLASALGRASAPRSSSTTA